MNANFLKFWLFLTIGIALTACKEHIKKDEFDLIHLEKKMPGIADKIKELKGLKVFQGNIPCADCPMIKQRLAIKGDTAGIFRLTETYVEGSEDGDAVLVTTGEWRKILFTDSLNRKEWRYYLSEGTINDSSRIQQYRIMKNKINQLDINGKSIKSNFNYSLKLIYKDDN